MTESMHPLLDARRWRIVRHYTNGRIRVVMRHESGHEVSGTVWGVDDGSAEAEAGARLERYMREYANTHGLPDPFAARDASIAERLRGLRDRAKLEPSKREVRAAKSPAYVPPNPVREAPSAVRDDGGACSCHLNPPCTFCTTLTEEEADAYDAAGHDGLAALWSAWDDQQETPGD